MSKVEARKDYNEVDFPELEYWNTAVAVKLDDKNKNLGNLGLVNEIEEEYEI